VNKGEDCFKFYPPDPDGSYMTIQNGETVLNSASIVMRGGVTFSDLAGEGSTTINGSNITTGTIKGIELITESYDSEISTATSKNYYRQSKVDAGGIYWQFDRKNDSGQTLAIEAVGNIVAAYDENYATTSETKQRMLMQSTNGAGIAIESAAYIDLEVPSGRSVGICRFPVSSGRDVLIGTIRDRIWVDGTIHLLPNGSYGTSGQVLKSGGSDSGAYWGDATAGLTADIVWKNSSLTAKPYRYDISVDFTSYKFIVIVGRATSTGSRLSVTAHTSMLQGVKYQLADDGTYINFNVSTGGISGFAGSTTGGLDYILGIK